MGRERARYKPSRAGHGPGSRMGPMPVHLTVDRPGKEPEYANQRCSILENVYSFANELGYSDLGIVLGGSKSSSSDIKLYSRLFVSGEIWKSDQK